MAAEAHDSLLFRFVKPRPSFAMTRNRTEMRQLTPSLATPWLGLRSSKPLLALEGRTSDESPVQPLGATRLMCWNTRDMIVGLREEDATWSVAAELKKAQQHEETTGAPGQGVQMPRCYWGSTRGSRRHLLALKASRRIIHPQLPTLNISCGTGTRVCS